MRSFLEYYGDEWRDRIVTHRTPTGQINKVKVRSLPPEEQLRYNPNRFKRLKSDTKMSKSSFDNIKIKELPNRVIDMYIALNNINSIDEFKQSIKPNKLILSTTNSKNVFDMFDKNSDIGKIIKLPIRAIKGVIIINDNNELSIKDISKYDDEQLYELVKFSDNDIFLIDIYPYLNIINIIIDKYNDNNDNN